MLFLVHAYSTLVWKLPKGVSSTVSAAAIEHGFQSPEGHSKLVMDGPWILLWPCLLLWPWFEAVVGFGWIHNALRKYKHKRRQNAVQLALRDTRQEKHLCIERIEHAAYHGTKIWVQLNTMHMHLQTC